MRIALIVTDLTPPRMGGISKVATELAKQYSQMGHDLVVFCLKRTCDVFPTLPGCQLIEVEPKWSFYREYPVMSFSLAAFKKLLAEHQRDAFDVSHAMNFNNYGFPFNRRKMRKLNLAHVSTAFETTGMEIAAKWQEWRRSPTCHGIAQILMECYFEPWQRAYIGWGDVITTEDVDTKEHLMRMGIDGDKIQLIPSGIPLDELLRASEELAVDKAGRNSELRFVCPGRVDPRKGTQFLIEAFDDVKKEFPESRLTFAGGGRGDYIDKMNDMIRSRGLSEHVEITGAVESMYPYYINHDVVVIPSLSEGIPITLQEALVFNKPVICSQLTGTHHFASHINSISWAQPGDSRSLADAMLEFCRDKGQHDTREGFEFMKGFDWSCVAKEYLKAYERAIAKYH